MANSIAIRTGRPLFAAKSSIIPQPRRALRTSARSATCRWRGTKRSCAAPRATCSRTFRSIPANPRSAGRRRRVVHGLSSDQRYEPGHAREFRRRIWDRREDAGQATPVYGPFEIDKGHADHAFVVEVPPDRGRSTSGRPSCVRRATRCTRKRSDRDGKVIGELPEQVPYQEWLHSDFKEKRELPVVSHAPRKENVPITSVFGEPREGCRAARVRRREFLHAADAEPLSARARRSRRHPQEMEPRRFGRLRTCMDTASVDVR